MAKPLPGHPAAVDHEVFTGNEGGILTGKEQGGRCDILRQTQPRPRRAGLGHRKLVGARDGAPHSGHGTAGSAAQDLARRHRIADDAVFGIVGRHLLGQVDDTGLADAIGKAAGRGDHAVLGRDIDDPPTDLASQLLFQHLLRRCLASKEHAFQVDREGSVPIFFGGLRQSPRCANTGIVDDDIEATVARDNLVNGRQDVIPPRDIAPQEFRGATRIANEVARRCAVVRRRFNDISQKHMGPFGCETDGNRTADAIGGASDDRGLVLESGHEVFIQCRAFEYESVCKMCHLASSLPQPTKILFSIEFVYARWTVSHLKNRQHQMSWTTATASQLLKFGILYSTDDSENPVGVCGPIGLSAAGLCWELGKDLFLDPPGQAQADRLENAMRNALQDLENNPRSHCEPRDWPEAAARTEVVLATFSPCKVKFRALCITNNAVALLAEAQTREPTIRFASDRHRTCCEAILGVFIRYLMSETSVLQALMRCLVDLLEQLDETSPDSDKMAHAPGPDAQLVDRLYGLANRLAMSAEHDRALEAIEATAGFLRTLAADNPKHFTPDLALCLHDLSLARSAVGLQEPALDAVRESVALQRNLGDADPELHFVNFAHSLQTLARRFVDIGDAEEAMMAIGESVDMMRDLAEHLPKRFNPEFASALDILADISSDIGNLEFALHAIEEAVSVRRMLTAIDKDLYLAPLAMNVTELATAYSNLGDLASAHKASAEAVALFRDAHAMHEGIYLEGLAMSLNNHAELLRRIGEPIAAHPIVTDAVALYRDLAIDNPDEFMPDVAMSLTNMANILSTMGKYEEALQTVEEAIAIRSRLAEGNPDANLPNLIGSRAAKAVIFSDQDRTVEARTELEGSLNILLPPFQEDPEALISVAIDNVRHYCGVCQMMGDEPDWTFIAPYMEIFDQMGLLVNAEEET